MTDFRRGEASEDGNSRIEGRSPGLSSAGGAQLQQQGLLGKLMQRALRRWGTLYAGRKPANCGPVSSPECADVTSEFLEQTFRNFHLNTAPRTNLSPPWLATTIDPQTDLVTVTGANPPAFTTINSYSVQQGRIAIISHLGQVAATPAIFGDTTWRIVTQGSGTVATDGGGGVDPFQIMTGYQRFRAGAELLANPIRLIGPMVIAWQVRVNTFGMSYDVAGRIWGWDFAPLSRSGDMIASAIAE